MHTHHVDINRYIQTTEGAHSILIWIVIGLIAGYLTGRIMRGAGFGPLVDIIVGIVGAIRVYSKWNSGDQDINKELMGWGGSCVFLVVSAVIIKAFFGLT